MIDSTGTAPGSAAGGPPPVAAAAGRPPVPAAVGSAAREGPPVGSGTGAGVGASAGTGGPTDASAGSAAGTAAGSLPAARSPEADAAVDGSAPEPPLSGRLPVADGTGRFLVLLAVFVCAACGLVYELTLIAVADHLVGDTVTQTSVVLSFMVFAMGIGSLAAKRLRTRASLGFGLLEAALALVGGTSTLVLFAVQLWFGEIRPVLFAFALVIGFLIGMEMPLLMTLIQRIRRQDAGGAVADLSAADYVGALLGGLAFPFLLLPHLGRLNAALLTGVVNAVAGGAVVLWLFHRDLTRRGRALLVTVSAAVVVALAASVTLGASLDEAVNRSVERADPADRAGEPGAPGETGAGAAAGTAGAREAGPVDGEDAPGQVDHRAERRVEDREDQRDGAPAGGGADEEE